MLPHIDGYGQGVKFSGESIVGRLLAWRSPERLISTAAQQQPLNEIHLRWRLSHLENYRQVTATMPAPGVHPLYPPEELFCKNEGPFPIAVDGTQRTLSVARFARNP